MRFVKDPDFAQFCMAVILAIILFSLPPLVGGQLPPNKIDTKHCSHHGFPNGSVSGGAMNVYVSGYYGLDCNMRFVHLDHHGFLSCAESTALST